MLIKNITPINCQNKLCIVRFMTNILISKILNMVNIILKKLITKKLIKKKSKKNHNVNRSQTEEHKSS